MPQICECGCGREFTASNTGTPRRFFERKCQRSAKQRRYYKRYPAKCKALAKKRWLNTPKEILRARGRAFYAAHSSDQRLRCRTKAQSSRGRDRAYRRQFGISYADYQTRLQEQDGLCAVCRTATPGPVRKNWTVAPVFAVDHEHSTGRVRGLLCDLCNRGLGLLQDSADVLTRAIAYLQKDLFIYSEERRVHMSLTELQPHLSPSQLKSRRRALKLRGLSEQVFTSILRTQDFKCALCGRQEPLCLDHCHRTGEVRGLLCLTCNCGLGHFHDDIAKLEGALRYIRPRST